MRNLLTIALIALTFIACDKDKEETTPNDGGMEAGATAGTEAGSEAGTEMDMMVMGGSEETTDMEITEGGTESDMGMDEAGMESTDMEVVEGGSDESTDMGSDTEAGTEG